MFDFLKDNLLIICPNSYKGAILKYLADNKLLFNIKFMTVSEYKKAYYFDYDVKTIHYLVSKDMKVENAVSLLNNLYYIEDKDYHNDKLNYLVNIKHELDELDLLIYDDNFKKILKRFEVVIYGYGKLDSFNLKMFSNNIIIPYSTNDKNYDIYHVLNINDEVEMVFQRIIDLLNNGIDINNISIMNIDNEYFPTIKKMEKYYGIKVDLPNQDSLMGTILGNKFYELVLNNNSCEEIISLLDNYSDLEDYQFIIDLLNKYRNYNLYEVREEIKYELLNKNIKSKTKENVIKVKNLFDYVSDDEIVFLMNFNNGSIPSYKMDIDYITNDIKEKVDLLKIEDENELIKENTINYISNINNLIISYKDKSPFNSYYPSTLLDDIKYQEKKYERSFNYSELANKCLYTKYLDDYIKYGTVNNNLSLLLNNYGTNDYLSYDNKYTSIDKDKLLKYLNNELTLSYSSIDNFYQCSFKYYINNILKLNMFDENFYTIIGNLFHYVLSHINEDDFNIDVYCEKYLSNKEFTYKEKFFLDKLKNDLVLIVDVVRKQHFISGFTNMLFEQKIDIKIMDSPYVHFKGFVDKIMYKEKNNENLVSIIDYKTGNPDIKINNLEFGLSMQLPIYLYLVKNSDLLKNMKFTGFYLQHILNTGTKKNSKKDVLEQKIDNLKLVGYSTSDMERLACFDETFENSEMIYGMKLKKDGSFSSSAKVLTDDEVDEILRLTMEKINMAMDEILSGNFIINPKILNGKNVSCEYCTFKDLCYHTEKDNVYLWSRGDDDANMDEGTE